MVRRTLPCPGVLADMNMAVHVPKVGTWSQREKSDRSVGFYEIQKVPPCKGGKHIQRHRDVKEHGILRKAIILCSCLGR